MSTSFRALLAQTSETIERPRAVAPGHYRCTIKSFEFGTSRQKQTPYIRFTLSLVAETDDCEGANEGMDLTKKELRKDYFLTPGALYRLSDMMDAVLGKELGRTLDDRIGDLRGQECLSMVTVRTSEDGSESFNDVDKITGVSEE